MKNMFFDWQYWRLAYSSGSTYQYIRVEDQSEWYMLCFGLYWRVKEAD